MPAGVTVRPRNTPTVLPHQDGRAAGQRGSLGPTRLERRQPSPADRHQERSPASEAPAHGALHLTPGGAVPLRFPIRSSTLPLNSKAPLSSSNWNMSLLPAFRCRWPSRSGAGIITHGVTSKASTTIEAPAEAGFLSPVTSIVNVWLVLARPCSVKTVFWGASAAAYVSRESATTVPSRITRAIPLWGPLKPIQLTEVPLKLNVA